MALSDVSAVSPSPADFDQIRLEKKPVNLAISEGTFRIPTVSTYQAISKMTLDLLGRFS